MTAQQEHRTVCDAIRYWSERTPKAPALIADGQKPLSYSDLAALMDKFQTALNASGFGRNDRIAIVHPGGAEMAATIVGIWSCATAVPLNPDLSLGEFAIYLRDHRVQAIVIDEGMETPARSAAQELGLPVLTVAHTDKGIAGAIDLRPGPKKKAEHPGPAMPDDLALVLATSGTTSHSKIVPTRHRHLTARIVSSINLLQLTTKDICLNLMPLFHGHGLYTSLATVLYSGGGLICMAQFEMDEFFHYLEAYAPTWYSAGYTFHHAIYAVASDYMSTIDRTSLRFIRTSSGRLDPKIADALETIFGVPVIETYSTTETGRISGNPLPPAIRKRGTVGKSAGAEIAIMGVDNRIVAAGERGEIVVRGPQILDGYENDPAANRAAFVDGWFRTGDEGMLDSDGYLSLTGRTKDIINRGGEKITPSEVDNALMRHPDVTEAVCFPIPHVTLGEELAAAVVPEPGMALTDEILGEFLRNRLSPFKIPRRFVFVDSLPKSATGKFQRHALAAAFGLDDQKIAKNRLPADDRPPTVLEAKLQSIWADTLGLDSVGLQDDFFLLGGDSLQAVGLFLRIEADLGRRLPRSILFKAGNVAEMARQIDAFVPSDCLVPIQQNGDALPFFCVHDGNGHVLNFRDLSRCLGDSQPFYGIQSVGLDGEAVPFTRIEDMAAHYIREIRKVQPTGPYHIGGYSFGGRVAYVMAQQLRDAGEDVALLALLDTYCHSGQRRVGWRQWLGRHIRRFAALQPSEMPAYLGLRFKNLAVMIKISLRLKLFSMAWEYFETRKRPIPRFLHRPVEANDMIRRDYRAKPYDGTAVLFKAELYAWNHPDAHDGWRDLVTGGLRIRSIPGHHFEIMKPPHVQTLAAELADCLKKVQVGEEPKRLTAAS